MHVVQRDGLVYFFVRLTDLFRNLTGIVIKGFYLFREFGTLPVGAAAQCAGVVGPIEQLARALRGLLRARGATGRVPSLSARPAQRQSPQIDERDARAGQRSGTYRGLSAFHHRRAVDGRADVASLRATIPDRDGVLILDGTSFPKQGPHSVGVARQYCGTLGKIANCQVAVTAALWTGAQAWMLGASLYLPDAWLTSDARQRAQIPALGAVPGEMAARPDVVAADPRERVHRDGGRGGCRIRRECHAASGAASRAAAVWLGVSSDAEVFSAHPAGRARRPWSGMADHARAASWRQACRR